MAFLASDLELSDLGSRIRVTIRGGAVIEDTLTNLNAEYVEDDEVRVCIQFASFGPGVEFELLPGTYVDYVIWE